ncbi:MAG: hypothetical protein QOG64_1908, partial [Acidimicrobiaceae bacterium]|nr:hypothetical protein [Acidimicrobiaceae bacterium]
DPRELPPPTRGGATIRGAARQILSRPEFRRPGKSLQQRAFEWIRDRIIHILDAARPGTAIGLVVVAVGVVVVVFLVVRFGRTVQADPDRAVLVTSDVGRPATDWRAEAAAHEEAGQWRQALRCRYRALVADLAARGLVDEIPGRTSGEYRAEVAMSRPGAAEDFGGATDLFERAWYGSVDAGPDENERFRALADRVLVGVER